MAASKLGWVATLRTPSAKIIAAIQLFFVGALYPLGFAPIGLWPLSLASLMLLVYALLKCLAPPQIKSSQTTSTCSKRPTGWHALAHFSSLTAQGSLFQIVLSWSLGAFGLGVSWVYVSIHNYGHASMFLAAIITGLFILLLAAIKATCFLLLRGMVGWFGRGRVILILPFVWVVSEFVQTQVFSGFPWLFAGYSQLDGPLNLLSSWLGVYGVGWDLIVIACFLVLVIIHYFQSTQRVYWRTLTIPVATVALLLPLMAKLLPDRLQQASTPSLRVALVQPNIAQNDKWDRRYFSRIMDILYQQSEDHWQADLILWPEGAIPAYRHQVEDILQDLSYRAVQQKMHLVMGLPVHDFEQDISYSAMIALGTQPQEYHKQVLVPFGEYVPLGQWLRGVIQFFNLPMSSFSPATEAQKAMEFDDFILIPAICYEITYPNLIQTLVKRADQNSTKPQLLVTISNDAWFGSSFGPDQHLQMARMRALELGLPLVRATNDGITAVVDARGRLIKRLARYQQATLDYEVSLNYYDTFYRRVGLWGIGIILLLSLVLLSFHRVLLGRNRSELQA